MCPTDRQLLRLLEDPVTAGTADRETRSHLCACAACRRRVAELRSLWRLLGEWDEAAGEPDMAARVVAEVATEATAAGRRPDRAWQLRAAASVLLAVGVGIVLGGVVPVGRPAPLRDGPSPDRVVTSLGLDLLGGEPAELGADFVPAEDAL